MAGSIFAQQALWSNTSTDSPMVNEDGTYCTIALSWDDTARSLTIGRRHGSFDGMEKTRTFTVNVLGEEKTAVYNGKETVVSF